MKDKFFSGINKASEFLQRPTPPIVETVVQDVINDVVNDSVPTDTPPTPPPPPPPIIDDEDQAEYEEPLTDEDLEEQAETYIVLLEMVLNLVFSIAAKYKRNNKAEEIAGENGVEKMKAIVKKLKANERAKKKGVINIDPLTDEENLLAELHSDVESFLDETDLSDAEKRKLMKPLILIVKKRKKKLSPEQLFFAGIASIAVTRIAMFKML